MNKNVYDLIKKDYDSVCEWYINKYDSSVELKKYIDLFLKSVPSGKSILDLGCASGKESSYMAKDHEVIGIDFSEKMIQVAKNNYPDLKFEIMDAREVGEKFENLGGIWASRVLFHFPPQDIDKVIAAIYKVLETGGTFGLVTIINEKSQDDGEEEILDDPNNQKYIRYLYLEENIISRMTKVGFEVIEKEKFKSADNDPHLFLLLRK
jgi:cyclopropane fatty-acyl-phospholipid synthase-like methyltransferase